MLHGMFATLPEADCSLLLKECALKSDLQTTANSSVDSVCAARVGTYSKRHADMQDAPKEAKSMT